MNAQPRDLMFVRSLPSAEEMSRPCKYTREQARWPTTGWKVSSNVTIAMPRLYLELAARCGPISTRMGPKGQRCRSTTLPGHTSAIGTEQLHRCGAFPDVQLRFSAVTLRERFLRWH